MSIQTIYIRTTTLHFDRWWTGKIREKEGREDLTEDSVRDNVLGKGAPAPDIGDVKDFLRFYGLQSEGRIYIQELQRCAEHASVESVVSTAEAFFAGFTRETGTDTLPEDRSEVFHVCIPTQ